MEVPHAGVPFLFHLGDISLGVERALGSRKINQRVHAA